MKEHTLKIKKGGVDTIVAYIVVMLPLLYVLIYMVATIYHFSVQTYMNQVVKEAAVMASTYGTITEKHENYIHEKLEGILGKDNDGKANCEIKYYVRKFDDKEGVVGDISDPYTSPPTDKIEKADIIGIQVTSTKPSILETVTAFNVFERTDSNRQNELKYTSYREEIIRNENPENPSGS